MRENNILSVHNLNVRIGETLILSDITMDIADGERIGIAGPSGSGKTMLAWTIIGGQPDTAIVDGIIQYSNDKVEIDLLSSEAEAVTSILGSEIAIIPQNPYSSLNPSRTCGDQIMESIRKQELVETERIDLCIANLSTMGFEDSQRIFDSYPHQLSGGQLQRVVLAMAIINGPKLLIADEPTTALDTMTTNIILDLLDKWIIDNTASLLLVSHDWSVLSRMCNTILSLDNGKIVLRTATKDLNVSSKALKENGRAATDRTEEHIESELLLRVEKLSKSFKSLDKGTNDVLAVDQASFNIAKGDFLGLVGESGSGKSTIAKLLTGLEMPDAGTMAFKSHTVDYFENQQLRKDIQMIFQDPYSALYPHRTIGYSIEEPLKLHHKMHKSERRARAMELMQTVDLDLNYYDRYPRHLSGGERQRVQIARALSVDPSLLICDECISGLDIPVQARILGLLKKLKEERGISILFISHDLNAVRFLCDNVVVMSNGRIVESGKTNAILSNPQHEITQNLVSAMAFSTNMS